MKIKYIHIFRSIATAALLTLSFQAVPDDIDIYVGASASSPGAPNVLIVLDNTANWSRQSQQWPGGLQQGQSEVRAIKTAIGQLNGNINVGLMEFVTGGNANENGGYIRYAVSPMSTANQTTFGGILDTIFNNVTNPNEKKNANTPYGNLMYDVYNYFSGGQSHSPNAVVAALADSNGYTVNYTQFKSPLTADNACAKTVIIFIGNPDSRGPTADDAANTAALAALGGNTTQLNLPNFTTQVVPVTTNLGYTSQCYTAAASCSTADYSAQCAAGAGYDSCSCSGTDTTATLASCGTGLQRYSVLGTNTTSTTSSSTPTSTATGTSACYANAAACNGASDHGGLTCPANTDTGAASNPRTVTTYSCSYSCGATAAGTCASTTVTTGPTQGTATTSTACSTNTYNNSNAANTGASSDPVSVSGTLKCPAQTTTGGGTTPPGTVTTYSCTYAVNSSTTCSTTGGKHFTITRTATPSTTTYSSVANNKFVVTQNQSQNISTTTTNTTTTNLGNTFQCYSSPAAGTCSTADYASCSGTGTFSGGCACSAPSTTAGSCPAGLRYQVLGNTNTTVVTPTNPPTYSPPPSTLNADEWSRFFLQSGVNTPAGVTPPGKRTIKTYTIDVFNKQQNATQTGLLLSMAKVGGGQYFSATNEQAIVNALKDIFVQIQSSNSTFASASLPVNATNRAQNENQVYIGMFRPDPDAKPRWYGNLKRYQLISTAAGISLGDSNSTLAINPLTGFLTDCATSYWTSDSGTYWLNVPTSPTPSGKCTTTAFNMFSDAPDGPFVEKGAVAEVVRKGNSPPTTDSTPTNVVNRTVTTLSGGALTAFSTTSSGLPQNVVDYVLGKDVNDENNNGNVTEPRPSIHGDVVHSRPLPVNYGGTTGITVYYGANDGSLRAVDAATGRERWAFVAPEFFPRLSRLVGNSPLINYPKLPAGITPAPTPKDYFFDGSIGQYQNADNTSVMIFPSMRRGGRMIYAFDVTDPASPVFKWRAGCPNLGDDNGCSTGMSGIGQTWSLPNAAFIKGFSTTNPVLIVGGGYDGCEDADTSAPSCASPKGNQVYILNAISGTVIQSFTTARSVVADTALIDVDNDGNVDYAYVADTGGNIYRIDFVATTLAPLSSGSWTMNRVAYTNGAGRKFEFAPALLPVQKGNVYLALGSGDREHPLQIQYPYSTVTNRFYVYIDKLASTAANNLDDPTVFKDYTTSSDCNSAKIFPNDPNYKGWFMNLNQNGAGEQTVTSAVIAAGLATFSTNRPLPSSTTSCSTPLGEARGYFVNLFNASGAIGVDGSCGGDQSSTFVGGGLPPSPVLARVPIKGSDGKTRIQTVLIGAVQKGGGGGGDGGNSGGGCQAGGAGASSSIDSQCVKPVIKSKRKASYWKKTGTDD